MCPYFREKLTENFVVTEIITTFAIGSEEKYRASKEAFAIISR